MVRSDKDSLSTDTVHIQADSSLQVVHVDKAHFGYNISDTEFFSNLHRHREICSSFWWEVELDSLLLERRVVLWMVNLYYLNLHMHGKNP